MSWTVHYKRCKLRSGVSIIPTYWRKVSLRSCWAGRNRPTHNICHLCEYQLCCFKHCSRDWLAAGTSKVLSFAHNYSRIKKNNNETLLLKLSHWNTIKYNPSEAWRKTWRSWTQRWTKPCPVFIWAPSLRVSVLNTYYSISQYTSQFPGRG